MDLGTAMVAIAGIGAWYSLRSHRIRNGGAGDGFGMGLGTRNKRFGSMQDPAQPSPRELELQKEVEGLRDRIHVLERIATDGRSTKSLAAEIESLRDA